MGRKLYCYLCDNDDCRVIVGDPKSLVYNTSGDMFCSLECKLNYEENMNENQEREVQHESDCGE